MAEGSASFGKMEIVNRLATRFGYRRYLEFATSTTGHEYGRIDRGRFDECRRLLYNRADDFADGLPIDYRAVGLDIAIPAPSLRAPVSRERRRSQFAHWTGFGDDHAAAWRYFAVHHKSLLDLIEVDAFLASRDRLG